MKITKITLFIVTGLVFHTCVTNDDVADAYGNFEAREIIVSAEASGMIMDLDIEEGQLIEKMQEVGWIDTSALHLQKQMLSAQKEAVRLKNRNVMAEMDVLEEQKKSLLKEKERFDKLLEDGAATEKQMDDLIGNLAVLDKRQNVIQTQMQNIQAELKVVDARIDQVNEKIKKSVLVNPSAGTILEKYVEVSEMAVIGKPLYKIADMSTMILRIYISGSQLVNVNIGQKVRVYIDENEKEMQEMEGIVSWISSQAEFTPKIIQTKEERINLVYAVKVLVKNNGSLKIGMPAEVRFGSNN
ncbi:MAG: HlyD family efflux transporter periplasmic adaptor subunit [Bacteroidales bacterium]|nr:MAG: HlyD family efflux transporter periplasmic adaptor subunit [Bacteroidales bacterium]